MTFNGKQLFLGRICCRESSYIGASLLMYVCPLFFQMSRKRFRAAAMLLVFTISAVVHEYILAVCFGFFYPVLFCLFMCFGSKRNKLSAQPYSDTALLFIVDWKLVRRTCQICNISLFFLFMTCLHPHLHFLPSCSYVQLHSAWPKKRPHLERNYVDIPLPGSRSYYLSVLSGVVRPAILPLEGGKSYSLTVQQLWKNMHHFIDFYK